jgi:hypothetical protein
MVLKKKTRSISGFQPTDDVITIDPAARLLGYNNYSSQDLMETDSIGSTT